MFEALLLKSEKNNEGTAVVKYQNKPDISSLVLCLGGQEKQIPQETEFSTFHVLLFAQK